MNRAPLWASIVIFLTLVGGLLAFNLGVGNTPILGLDLRGGVSVILAPSDEGATTDDLGVVRDLVRDQLEATGIAEPDVRVEGENVVVDLPGVNDQEEALQKVSVSGIVTLRPVLSCAPGATGEPALGQEALPLLGGGTCVTGPAGATGEVFERKSAGVGLDQVGRWVVNVDLSSAGEAEWNRLAQSCFAGDVTCPTRQLAIVLDDVIQSAPQVQAPSFAGSVQISGDFSEDEARSLADVLNRGAFPFQMEQERVETVSATAGNDSLRAAIIAGLIGLVATLLFMVAYYRKLSIIILGGLFVWGMTVFSLATFVSQSTNYALTLAGATGIIVAVGVTVDTYVVLFERLRDEMRHGRTMRNAAPRSFKSTWRTIVAADLVSLMASFVLFWLSAGSVRGFALYLGLTTICDLVVCFFFTRPAVYLLSTTRWFGSAGAPRGETTADGSPAIQPAPIARLFEGQTAIDFVGRRRIGLIISGTLLVATVLSLWAQGLNLGIDFEGGVSWDVPAGEEFDVDAAAGVLTDNGLSTEGARLQERSSESGAFIKVQVEDQPEEVVAELRTAFAAAAGVAVDDVNVNLVSSSWGSEITEKAVRALFIFIALVATFISIRFEWRMAVAAIVAMVHDVLISVGIYSIFQFIVTPPTVIAFLTILGYSLYDTIVVFDRVKENEARFAAQKPPYDDIINVSMNQVLMRSLTTSFSSIVPVMSLLFIGAGVLGQSTLAEFALALLVGMVTGAYSSIYVAAPLLGLLKRTDQNWQERNIHRAVGDALREMVMGGGVGSRRTRAAAVEAGDELVTAGAPAPPRPAHPPRPRKKKRR